MNKASARLRALEDRALPAFRTILGREAAAMLGPAVATLGRRVRSAKPVQITWQPGRSLAVVYDVTVSDVGGHELIRDRLVAYTASELPTGAIHLQHGDQRVALWHTGGDPWLPGIAVALDAMRARGLLDALGVPAGPVRSRLRSYRPGRRAVVELTAGGMRLFLKAVQPRDARALHARHSAMVQHLPVPRSHGWSEEHGLVVLGALPGATLRETFAQRRPALPAPIEVVQLLARIPAPPDGRVGADPIEQARRNAHLLAALLPDLETRLRPLVIAISGTGVGGARVPVHGDLHEAQLIVRNGRISGLLDIDTVSLGHRIDDWATLIGHLAVWAPAQGPSVRGRTRAYLGQLVTLARDEVDAQALHLRVAGVILGLATGPFRAQSANWPAEIRKRIDLAHRWASQPLQPRENRLTSQSSLSHTTS